MTSLFFAQQSLLALPAYAPISLVSSDYLPVFPIAFISGFGYQEMFLFAVIALLLFGKQP